MIIELAQFADMSALCSLCNQARATNGSFPETAFCSSQFIKSVEGERILVARVDGEIAGFASVWEKDSFLHHLYVLPKYQRKGVGNALLEECLSQFGSPMSLKCIEANIVARHFYETLGWHAAEKAEGPEGRYILYVRESAE